MSGDPGGPSRPQPPRTQGEIEAEKALLGGPTILANRALVQNYPDGNFRLVFLESYTASPDVPPAFRCAVFVHRETAVAMAQQIIDQTNQSA